MARTKKRADGRYAKQVYIGLSPEGKRRYKTFYAPTQKEAKRLAAEFKTALGRSLDPEGRWFDSSQAHQAKLTQISHTLRFA